MATKTTTNIKTGQLDAARSPVVVAVPAGAQQEIGRFGGGGNTP